LADLVQDELCFMIARRVSLFQSAQLPCRAYPEQRASGWWFACPRLGALYFAAALPRRLSAVLKTVYLLGAFYNRCSALNRLNSLIWKRKDLPCQQTCQSRQELIASQCLLWALTAPKFSDDLSQVSKLASSPDCHSVRIRRGGSWIDLPCNLKSPASATA
jgi:hypothetical protein